MRRNRPYRPATLAAHAAGAIDMASGGIVPPIQSSTTFVRDTDYQLINPANIYSRDDSDIVRIAETILSGLERAEDALIFPSGMAAIAAVFRTVPTGGTIIVQSQIYYGTLHWLESFTARRGITLHAVPTHIPGALATACAAHHPDIVFIETPSNPWLHLTDIAEAATCAHAHGGLLVVDSTAASPILSQPLSHGADIVMHSASKSLNGHSDVLAGALATRNPDADIWQMIRADRHDAGAVIGTFEAWLLVRGMRTLPLRMERMCENAMALATWLAQQPQIEAALYPGLPNHPGHDIAQRQMSGGFGCLLSIQIKGGAEAALKVAGKLDLFHSATSLGSVESLVEHRFTIEPHTGIPPNLLRLSVGIEAIDDLTDDLAQALA